MRDDQLDIPLVQLSPVWAEVGRAINLERPGLPCVRRIMGWSPLHVAAMEGDVSSRCPCLHFSHGTISWHNILAPVEKCHPQQ